MIMDIVMEAFSVYDLERRVSERAVYREAAPIWQSRPVDRGRREANAVEH